jgi:hypothetical protein
MASSLSDDECEWWACDSTNKNELDPELKEAHEVALQAQDESAENSVQQEKWLEAESTEPIILRNLLSEEQIDEILTSASVEGVWPRGVDASSSSQPLSPLPSCDKVCEELQSVAHHYAWTEKHVALYMHNKDYWFVRMLPKQWSRYVP